MKQATHSGHCQACGRLQKLPGGVLSKHGYTVDGGYFSGVCCGAGKEPYELSCKLIKGFIKSATAARQDLVIEQGVLRRDATVNLAWIHEYRPATWERRYSRNVWIQAPVVKTIHRSPSGDFEWVHFHYVNTITHKDEQLALSSAKTELEACTSLNKNRARFLEHEVQQLSRYIGWQQRRADEWTLQPLLPVEHKDKEGFDLEGGINGRI